MLTRDDKITLRAMLKNEINFMMNFLRKHEMSDDLKDLEIKRIRKLNHIRKRILDA